MDANGPIEFMNAIPFFVIGLFWLAFWVFILVIGWRWMRAHESIAASLRSIAKSRQSGGPPSGAA